MYMYMYIHVHTFLHAHTVYVYICMLLMYMCYISFLWIPPSIVSQMYLCIRWLAGVLHVYSIHASCSCHVALQFHLSLSILANVFLFGLVHIIASFILPFTSPWYDSCMSVETLESLWLVSEKIQFGPIATHIVHDHFECIVIILVVVCLVYFYVKFVYLFISAALPSAAQSTPPFSLHSISFWPHLPPTSH